MVHKPKLDAEFEAELLKIMRHDMGRGLLDDIPDIELEEIAEDLICAKRVLILTGFPVRCPDCFRGETDGPSGATNLAAALNTCGWELFIFRLNGGRFVANDDLTGRRDDRLRSETAPKLRGRFRRGQRKNRDGRDRRDAERGAEQKRFPIQFFHVVFPFVSNALNSSEDSGAAAFAIRRRRERKRPEPKSACGSKCCKPCRRALPPKRGIRRRRSRPSR